MGSDRENRPTQSFGEEEEMLEELRSEVSEALAQTMDLYGVPPSIGKLFGILYFSEEPQTLDELREQMGMSKTSMSTGVRRLEKNKMVKKVWKKGVRKHLYESEDDFFKHFLNFFVTMWYREIEVNMDAIKRVEPYLQKLQASSNEEIKTKADKDLEKLEEAKRYYNWLRKLADAVESGKIFEYYPVD